MFPQTMPKTAFLFQPYFGFLDGKKAARSNLKHLGLEGVIHVFSPLCQERKKMRLEHF